MKNIFFIFLLAGFIFIAKYFYQNIEDQKVGDANVIEYIPVDTEIFSGFLTPFPIKNYLHSLAANYSPSTHNLNNTKFDLFLDALYKNAINDINNPDNILTKFGLANNVQAYLYTIDLKPVFKFQIKDANAFFEQLDLAEKKSGFTHKSLTISNNNYRQYELKSLYFDDGLSMVIGEHQDWITVTFQIEKENQEQLAQALGLKTIETSLESTNLLKELIVKNQFLKENVSFINHKSMINALTKTDANPWRKPYLQWLDKKLMSKGLIHLQMHNVKNKWQTDECRKALTVLADNWPMTVFGFTNMTITPESSDINLKMVIESRNKEMLSALSQLHGFIPAQIAKLGSSAFAVGIGGNTQNLTSTMSVIWNNFTKPESQCAIVAEMQSTLNANDPMFVSMAAGMMQGLLGASFSVFDYKVETASHFSRLSEFDGALTLSSENPLNLLNVAQTFIPRLSSIDLSKKGATVDLSPFMSSLSRFNFKPTLAVKGKNLVVYTGDKSKQFADQLATTPLSFNGLFSMSLDAKKMQPAIANLDFIFGKDYKKQFLTNGNSQLNFHLNSNDTGVVFKSQIRMFAK